MHTPSMAEYVACLERADVQGVADLMLSSATKLARMGADLLICPDNTIHQAFHLVEPHSPREINRIIMDELVEGRFRTESIAYLHGAIRNLATQGCDAVALACTELPLVLDDGTALLPTLDSTRLLAREAVTRASQAGSKDHGSRSRQMGAGGVGA